MFNVNAGYQKGTHGSWLIRKKLFTMVPDNRVISFGCPEISEFWKADHQCPVAGMVFTGTIDVQRDDIQGR
jgi:hypothetical protein